MVTEKRYERARSAVSTNVDGEEILLDSERGVYFSLNEVATDVWRIMAKPTTLNELVKEICNLYEVDEATCEGAILDLMKDLQEHRLIETKPEL